MPRCMSKCCTLFPTQDLLCRRGKLYTVCQSCRPYKSCIGGTSIASACNTVSGRYGTSARRRPNPLSTICRDLYSMISQYSLQIYYATYPIVLHISASNIISWSMIQPFAAQGCPHPNAAASSIFFAKSAVRSWILTLSATSTPACQQSSS